MKLEKGLKKPVGIFYYEILHLLCSNVLNKSISKDVGKEQIAYLGYAGLQ